MKSQVSPSSLETQCSNKIYPITANEASFIKNECFTQEPLPSTTQEEYIICNSDTQSFVCEKSFFSADEDVNYGVGAVSTLQ